MGDTPLKDFSRNLITR